MFTPQYYFTPFRLGTRIDYQPEPPVELANHFVIAEKVSRYRFSEEACNFIFQDNVLVHTKRLINYLHNIALPDFLDREVIERMLWLHDIPEAIVNEVRGSDYVTHEKNADEELSTSQDHQEESVARLIFSNHDFDLFMQTEHAKSIIKSGNWSDPAFTRNAIFAKMLDWIDGRNTFAGVLAKWMASDEYSLDPILPPHGSFELCFLQSYQTWMNQFKTLEDVEFRQFMRGFIHCEYYLYYIDQWSPVIARAPKHIQDMYQDFIKANSLYKVD